MLLKALQSLTQEVRLLLPQPTLLYQSAYKISGATVFLEWKNCVAVYREGQWIDRCSCVRKSSCEHYLKNTYRHTILNVTA